MTMMLAFVAAVGMDSINPTKDHSLAKFVAWEKLREPVKQSLSKSVGMNAEVVFNLDTKGNVNLVQEARTEHKASNLPARHVLWAERRRKRERQRLKSVLCLCVHQVG